MGIRHEDVNMMNSDCREDLIKIPLNNADNIFLEAGEQFTVTTHIQGITEKALTYLKIGYAAHLAGPAGTGKTTIALHVAAQLGRPVVLIHGDDEFTGSDLVGRGTGYHHSKLVDNFIHSVLKTEEEMTTLWMDNRLTTACERGYTLIYDEFNRSRAEANNALLSVLSEGILNLPGRRQRDGVGYLEVHPDFRAIFTSNSEEYVGIHKTQNALTDRLITINVTYPDQESEIQIVQKKSGLSRSDAEVIVGMARMLRLKSVQKPSIRGCIAVARVLVFHNHHADPNDPVFQSVCQDVFGLDAASISQFISPSEPGHQDKANVSLSSLIVSGVEKLKGKTKKNKLRNKA